MPDSRQDIYRDLPPSRSNSCEAAVIAHRGPWSYLEQQTLRKLADEGLDRCRIAAVMNRTPGDISNRATALGLKLTRKQHGEDVRQSLNAQPYVPFVFRFIAEHSAPTQFRPGSEQKVDLMTRRASAHEPIFVDGDFSIREPRLRDPMRGIE